MKHKSRCYTCGFVGKHGKKKGYQLKGDGFFSDFKKFARNSGKFLLNNSQIIGQDVLRSLGPQVLSLLASKAGEHASKAGAPDFLVNKASELAQKGVQKLSQESDPGLSKNQRLVSQFVSNNSQNILNDIMKRTGNGSSGSGARLLGTGSRLLGTGVSETFTEEAPRI